MWQLKNYNNIVVPDPLMRIKDPARLYCYLPAANLAMRPWKTKVIPSSSSPTWPSSGQPVELACGDFETCADEFTTPIAVGLYYDDTATPWGPGMGGADHLSTTTVAGRSSLTITLHNPDSTPSSDAAPLEHGEVEYSAPECSELDCPLYLANLTISNDSSAWTLYSDELLDDVSISEVSVQLRRPALGVWNTATGEFYFGEQRIELVVTGTLEIGEGPPMTETFFVTNDAAIFGQLGPGGEVEIDELRVDNSEFSLHATLDYDSYAGSPTTVNLAPVDLD
ncbi:hypothetical protein DB30_06973 [Enhygromyxa salina]|uniref:Uncharacterized protein n=1 Tax=Enhygromyxa salina TaxID=215803 RepID=A0A0C1Z9I8_9BACT|nr:hypothetical protein [Enhygromyxa salina]KIG14224.1 hypothetical protein DB30_06973 [Enhygromyxa salina]